MRFAGLILMVLWFSTFSCAPMIIEGRKIDSKELEQLIMGQTEVAKVEELFGKPVRVEKSPWGGERYVYYFYSEEYTHWWTLPRMERQKLEVRIKDGVVQNYRYSEQFGDAVTRQDL